MDKQRKWVDAEDEIVDRLIKQKICDNENRCGVIIRESSQKYFTELLEEYRELHDYEVEFEEGRYIGEKAIFEFIKEMLLVVTQFNIQNNMERFEDYKQTDEHKENERISDKILKIDREDLDRKFTI